MAGCWLVEKEEINELAIGITEFPKPPQCFRKPNIAHNNADAIPNPLPMPSKLPPEAQGFG